MLAIHARSPHRPCSALRIWLLAFLLVLLAGLAAGTTAAQDLRNPWHEASPGVATTTRLVPLYYMRDTQKVIAMVRGPTESQRLESLVQERRRLQNRQAALHAQRRSPTTEVMPSAYFAPVPGPSIEWELARIEGELRILDSEERALAEIRTDALESDSLHAADGVRITVAGEGQLHLCGPLDGVNAITRMIHEIDQPVGQVKLGIHVVQFTGQEENVLEGIQGIIERSLGHARQMSQTSQALFRTALSNIAAGYYSADPDHFEAAFFYEPIVRNFRIMNGPHARLSIPLLDSRDVVTTLYLTGLATTEARRKILAEFQRLVDAELPKRHRQYQLAIIAAEGRQTKSRSWLPSFAKTGDGKGLESQVDSPPLDFRFDRTNSYFESFGDQADSANAIQVATARFQRALLELRQAEAAVAAMRNDRLLLTVASTGPSLPPRIRTVSGDLLDAAAFATLADRVIEEQAARAVDLRQFVRAEVAALDGQLKRLTTAFDEDLRRQFYRPALQELRRKSGAVKAQMGQIQTTTIRTNDRTLARVSPSQVAVLERPVRPVLLQEGLQVAHGLALEAQSLAQYGSLQAAGNMMAPGSAALLGQTGLTPVPGQHLGQTVATSERISVSVGDDIQVTPVIQPDGCSVAFHLVYTHTPQRDTDGKTPISSGVRRHTIEADVHLPNLELQEVSRFRVALDAEQQGNGVPLLEDVPGLGALFRPRRTAASTTQENIILVDAVIYPTALALSEKSWLAADSADTKNAAVPMSQSPVTASGQDELTGWVLQTLWRQARENLSSPDGAQRIAHPAGEPVTNSAPRPFSR